MAKKKKSIKSSGDNVLVEHGEKIAFGAACALIAVFVWLGLSAPTYETTTPSKLYETAAVTANAYINDAKSWEKLEETREADLFADDRIANNTTKMNPAGLIYGPFSGPAWETLAKRTDPEWLPTQQFDAKFIRTQIATIVPETGDGKQRKLMTVLNELPSDDSVGLTGGMKYWMFAYRPGKSNLKESTHLAMTYDVVAGIGLIPFEEQKLKYREKFRYAEGWHALRDQPEYKFLQIQRSEDGGQTWVDINKQIDQFHVRYFAESAKEVVDKEYIIDGVSDPIPPFLSFDYREVAGHSEVPFRLDVELPEKEDEEADEPTDNTSSMFDEKKEEVVDEVKTVDRAKYRLARFFDPTPKVIGKTYQYRIRAWIVDPNSLDLDAQLAKKEDKPSRELAGGGASGAGQIDDTGGGRSADDAKANKDNLTEEERKWKDIPQDPINETMLAKSVRDRQSVKRDDIPEGQEELLAGSIPTPWSEVSEVTIPRNYARFYAGPVDAANKLKSADGITYSLEEQEDTAEIVAISSTPNLDVSIPVLNNRVFRGSMINFNTVAKFLHPITWDVKELNEYAWTDELKNSNDRRPRTLNGKFFETDAVVLDIMGGDKMPFSNSNTGIFNMPGEMIVMDSTGRLIVRDELDDATNFRISTFMGDDEEPDAERIRKEAEKDAGKKNDDGGGLDGGDR